MLANTSVLANPGEFINKRYTVAQVIGKGAMGEVYVVADQENDCKLLALKYMKIDPEYKPALDHFKSEFNTMTHLNHPNIAKVFDFEWDDDRKYYFFTSELIDGHDFVTSSKRLDIEQIELLLIQSLRALEYLHGHNIYHYDIKPQNILIQDALGQSPTAKVIDFGLASTKPPEKLVGTPSYIAPELIERKIPDGRADLYSLGVLAYFALTGKNPFRAATKEDTLQNHLKITPAPPSKLNFAIPDYLSSVVMKLIERDPNNRYSLPSEVIHDINFRSPRFYAIETPETLLSYVPWEGPFIGRDDQIILFKETLKTELASDEISAFTIHGNLGTGKSRLLEELKNIAQLNKHQTLSTSSVDYKTIKKINNLKKPCVVFFDNFDAFLENPDTEILNSLYSSLQHLCAVFTINKSETISEKMHDFLINCRIKSARAVELTNFNMQDLRNYIKTLTGLSEAPSWITTSLFNFTEGNPLFLTETMKEMITRKLLFDSAGRWKRSTLEDLGLDFANLDVTKGLQERITPIFENLSDEEGNLACFISVLNKSVQSEAIKLLFKKDFSKDLNSLIQKNILRYDNINKTFEFCNPILKRTFYKKTAEPERRKIHDELANTAGHIFELMGDDLEYHKQRSESILVAKTSILKGIKASEKNKFPVETIDDFLSRINGTLDKDVFEIAMYKVKKVSASRNYTDARNSLEMLEDKLPSIDKYPELHFKFHLEMGSILKKDHKLEEAITHLNKAKEISMEIEDQTSQFVAENSLTGIDLAKGNVDDAIEKFSSSRKEMDKINEESRSEILNNDLGQAYFYKGEYDKAIEVLKDDVVFFKKVENKRQLLRALYAMADSYRHLRKVERAETIFKQVIEVAKQIDDIGMLYRAYSGLGNVMNDNAFYEQSVGYFERALDLAIHLGNYNDVIGIMINLAIINSNLGNNKKAMSTLETALNFLERKNFPMSLKDPYLCRVHLEMAELQRIDKKLEQASQHIEKALEFAKKPQASYYLFWVLITQAKIAKDMHADKSAKQIIKQAKKLIKTKQQKSLYKEIKRYKGLK